MGESARNIVRNSFWLVAGEMIGKVCTFIFFAAVARNIEVADFGHVNYALSFVTVAGLAADLGLTNYLFRELARYHSQAHLLVGNICLLRIVSLFVFIGAILVYLRVNPVAGVSAALVRILMIWFFSLSLLNVLRKAFRALEMVGADILLNILDNAGRLLVVIILLWMGWNVWGVAWSYALSTTVVCCLGLWLYCRSRGVLRFSVDWGIWKHAILEMRFLSLSALFLGLFGFFDVLILARYQDAVDVGLFSAPFKLVWMLLMIPCLITESAFPQMSRAALKDKTRFRELFVGLLKVNLLLSAVLATAVCIGADKILMLVYGPQYAASVFSFRLLIWYFVLYSVNIVFLYAFTALNRQMVNAVFLCGCIGINIWLDVIFAQHFSYRGLPLAPLLSASALLVANLIYSLRRGLIISGDLHPKKTCQEMGVVWARFFARPQTVSG